MKKLFTKIASLTLGLALAAGAVAFAGGIKATKDVRAVDTAYKTITFGSTAGTTTGSSGYGSSSSDTSWTYVCDDLSLNITNFNNNSWNSSWTYIKCGSKNYASTASIATNSALADPITKVTINIGAITATYITSITLYSGATSGAKTNTLGTFAKSTGDKTVTIASPAANLYYTIEVVCTQSKSNGPLTLNSITFYHEASDVYPTSISCPTQNINVLDTVNLSNVVVFSSGTSDEVTVKNLTYALASGSDYIDLDTATGVVTGKKGGTGTVTITAETNSSGGSTSCTATINVSSIASSGLTVGEQYVLYAIDETNSYNGELTGIGSNLGTVAAFTGDTPSCTLPLTVENGYYENTVAFNLGSSTYLSYTGTANELRTANSISATSSWKVTWDSSTNDAVILNSANLARSLKFNYNTGNPRFACYTSAMTAVKLYHFSEKDLENFTIEEEINVYVSENKAISVTYTPADASDKTLSWESGDTAIATVDSNGVVTGVAVGTTTVTASKTIDEINVERTCTVHVLSNVSSHRGTQVDPFDVNDAVNVAKGIFTKDPDDTAIDLTNTYYVEGQITAYVTRTTTNLSFWIGDDDSQVSAATGGFEVYLAASVYGTALGTMYSNNNEVTRDFNVGYKVIVSGTLTFYKSTTPETVQNTANVVYNDYIEAREYAESFNTAMEAVCDADGETEAADLSSAWVTQENAYKELEDSEKAYFVAATPKANGTAIEHCVATYDYVVGKYGVGVYKDFMSRNPASLRNVPVDTTNVVESSSAIIVVTVIAITSLSAIAVLLVIKRRRAI